MADDQPTEERGTGIPLPMPLHLTTSITLMTSSGVRKRFTVIQQTEDYFVVHDEDGNLQALEKDNCHIEVVSVLR